VDKAGGVLVMGAFIVGMLIGNRFRLVPRLAPPSASLIASPLLFGVGLLGLPLASELYEGALLDPALLVAAAGGLLLGSVEWPRALVDRWRARRGRYQP